MKEESNLDDRREESEDKKTVDESLAHENEHSPDQPDQKDHDLSEGKEANQLPDDKTENLLRIIGTIHPTKEKVEQCYPNHKTHLARLIENRLVGVRADGELFISKRG